MNNIIKFAVQVLHFYKEKNSNHVTSGTQAQVKQELTELAHDFDIDEIMVSTMTHRQEDRMRSFELLAEGCRL